MVAWAAASLGINALQAAGQYASNKARYKVQKKQQKYNNAVAQLTNAANQNAIVTNQTLAIQQSALQAEQIQRAGMAASGQAAVQSGATNTAGNSVDQLARTVKAAEATAQFTREENLKASFLQADQQSRNSQLAALVQTDYTPIEKPNWATAVLSLVGQGVQMAAAYDARGFNSGGGQTPGLQNLSYNSAGSSLFNNGINFNYGYSVGG